MRSKTLETMTSSKCIEHQTPDSLFGYLDEVFNFNLDVCATKENTKCRDYISQAEDFLSLEIGYDLGSNSCFWMNPPYVKPEFKCKPGCKKKSCVERGYHLDQYKPGKIDFIRHAYEQEAPCVMLVKNDPTTQWYKQYIRKANYRIFLDKRVKFELPDKKQTGAPHSSVIAIFRVLLSKNEIEYLSKLGEVVM
jgi:site-specific DNA-methyltransferase (adenine-specific)